MKNNSYDINKARYEAKTNEMKVNKILFPTFKHLNVNYKVVENEELKKGFEILNKKSDNFSKDNATNAADFNGEPIIEDGWEVLCENLVVPAGEEVRKCLYFKDKEKQAHRFVVEVEEEANLSLCFLFDLNKRDLIGDFEFNVGKDANVDLAFMFLNGRNVIYSIRNNLIGESANVNMESGYYAADGSVYEIMSEVNHIAPETECDVNMNGVLDDGSEKTYKYCVNFPSGCFGSSGNETETVLALGTEFKNTTVPMLLVGEDSIEAAHGSTLEETNPAVTDYIKSRGIGDVTTEYIYVLSKLSKSLDMFDDELKERGCKIVEELIRARPSNFGKLT